MALDPSAGIHYSQLGEDIVVRHVFKHYLSKCDVGFYIDVGAHHPSRLSNSALLYDQGWCGINIDADPEAVAAFELERPRDVNINAGVGYSTDVAPFYRFEGGAVSTFDVSARDALVARGNVLVETRMTSVTPLRELVKAHLSGERKVDYLNIDIEGHDMVALETYDFESFAPSLITIEDQGLNLHDVYGSPVFNYLRARGYSLISHFLITSLYLKTT